MQTAIGYLRHQLEKTKTDCGFYQRCADEAQLSVSQHRAKLRELEAECAELELSIQLLEKAVPEAGPEGPIE